MLKKLLALKWIIKKPYNFIGFILVFAYFSGLLLFASWLDQASRYPNGEVSQFFGGAEKASEVLTFFTTGFVITGILIITLQFYFFAKRRRAEKIKEYAEYTEKAKVISKEKKTFYIRDKRTKEKKGESKAFFITFELNTGDIKEFQIFRIRQYKEISESDTGILTYKQKGENLLFISFENDSVVTNIE